MGHRKNPESARRWHLKKRVNESENLTLSQLFFDINKTLCEVFPGLDPLRLLDYPAEDVFDLIAGLVDHNERNDSGRFTAPERSPAKNGGVIRRPAGDDWF